MPTVIEVQSYGCLLVLRTIFCSNQYDSIRCFYSIDGSCSVFQYRNVLNIIYIQIIKLCLIFYNTIYHKERSTHISDLNRSTATRLSRLLTGSDTGYFTNQCSRNSRRSSTGDIFCTNSSNCRSNTPFTFSPISHHNNLIQNFLIFFQYDRKKWFISNCNFYSFIAYIRKLQNIGTSNIQLKHSIRVSNSTCTRTGNPH